MGEQQSILSSRKQFQVLRYRNVVTCMLLHASLMGSRVHGLQIANKGPRVGRVTLSTSSELFLPRVDHQIRTVAAPMVAASDYAFRCLCRQYSNIDLCFTQMLLASHVVERKTFRNNHFDFYEYEPDHSIIELNKVQQQFLEGGQLRDKGITVDDHLRGPLIVQLAGHDPHMCAKAADLLVESTPGLLGVDLNCGCPQSIARNGSYGAFLMEADQGETVSNVLKAVRSTVPGDVSVSAKIRLALDEKNDPVRWQRLVDAGVSFVTVHGRTLRENKTAVAGVHTERLKKAVDFFAKHGIPVVANGGVEFIADAQHLLGSTGAAAIMSSEALLELPHLFQMPDNPTAPVTSVARFTQQMSIAKSYLNWCERYPPLPGVTGSSTGIARSHLFKFLHPYLTEHNDLRLELTKTDESMNLSNLRSIVAALEARYEQDESMPSNTPVSWYRRHRSKEIEEKADVSVADRKSQIRLRIQKLQEQKLKSAG